MRSNRFIKALMANPLWAYAYGRFVLGPMGTLLADRSVEQVLEVGCGRGDTTKLLALWFPGARIFAVDIDQEQIVLAGSRFPEATFMTADAVALPFKDGAFDLVAEFDSFHHVGDWRRAVAEASRVLRHGGMFAVLDLDARFFTAPIRFIDGPVTPFTGDELDAACASVGMLPYEDASRGPLLRRLYRKE